jgi:hypothetical protein
MDPKSLKDFIRDAIRSLTNGEPAPDADPPLMGRGLERC